jgi:hypothetical protein
MTRRDAAEVREEIEGVLKEKAGAPRDGLIGEKLVTARGEPRAA